MRYTNAFKRLSWGSWFCIWLFASFSLNAAAEFEDRATLPFAITYAIVAVVALALAVRLCLKTWSVAATIALTAALIVPIAILLAFNCALGRFLVYIYFMLLLLVILAHKYHRPRGRNKRHSVATDDHDKKQDAHDISLRTTDNDTEDGQR